MKLSINKSEKVLHSLELSKQFLPKNSIAYASITQSIKNIKPLVTRQMHQKRINDALIKIIDKYFHKSVVKFALWYVNVYYHDTYHAPEINMAYAMITDTMITTHEFLDKALRKAGFDKIQDARNSQHLSKLRNIIDQAEQYNRYMFVKYDVHRGAFVRPINTHDVLSIQKLLDRVGTLDFHDAYAKELKISQTHK